jgi:hypothetical protein
LAATFQEWSSAGAQPEHLKLAVTEHLFIPKAPHFRMLPGTVKQIPKRRPGLQNNDGTSRTAKSKKKRNSITQNYQ